MNFSAWSIHKPIPAILLFILLSGAGLLAFDRLGIQSFPDLDFPAISVVASLSGTTPSQLESEVARPIENSIASVADVEHIQTTITDGVVQLLIEFEFGKDLQEATTDVREAISRIRSTLPTELQEPVVSRISSTGLPVLTYAVSAEHKDVLDLTWFVDNTVSKHLLMIKGVADIRRQGGMNREVTVEVDPVRLQALNVTAGELTQQLRAMQQESPGGRSDLGGLEQAVRTIGTVTSTEQLKSVTINLADGRRLRLDEIANVQDGATETRQLALLNGKPVVSFQVMRAKGHDEVSIAENVRSAVAEMERKYPGMVFTEVSNTDHFIRGEFQSSMNVLYEGCFLAILVVWIFLRDWRATIISATALPLSIIPTFLIMSLAGYTLNMFTLLAMTLVIGILVDDAIVEVENIMRHLRNGKTPKQAALDAAQEIGLAVIATSMTLVAVFLPTAFVGGLTGAMFRQFGITASAAVIFSLLVARLLTPMMAAYTLKPQAHPVEDGPIMRNYLARVRWCLKNPKTTMAAAVVFFVCSLSLIPFLSTGFIPAQDASLMTLTVESPPGATIEHTREAAESARKIIQQFPDVVSVFTSIGSAVTAEDFGASASAGEVRIAQITVRLKEQSEREQSLTELQTALTEPLRHVPGARINIDGGASGEKLSLVLAGDNPLTLRQTAQELATDMRKLKGYGNVTTTASLLRPEIVIRPDFAKAAELGISSQAIGNAIRVATTGDYDFNLPRLNLPERQLYIRVQLNHDARKDLNTISQLQVMGSTGPVRLEDIAEITVEGGPAQINRYDRRRNINVDLSLQDQPPGDALKEVKSLPSLINLPADVQVVTSGDLELMQEMMDGFLLAMIAGIFCVYAVMVLLFHDFGQPATILGALPLATGGSLGFLFIFGQSLSMPSVIGLLVLIGIVTKNSILMVEYAIMARRDLGMNRLDALLDACHKRARPIVMTTVAMTAGMMPIAMNFEGDASFRSPMGVAVIGGLLTSTVLSLLVIPVVFEIVDDIKIGLKKRVLSLRAQFDSL